MYEKLQEGDILIVDRILYKHYGIYTGEKSVIHYADKSGDWGNDISIHETTLERFSQGETVIVGKFSEQFKRTHKIYSAKETVQRARTRLGERKYHLVTNNCEHFALWCKVGESRSIQVETTVDAICDFFLYIISDQDNKLITLSKEKKQNVQKLSFAPVEKIELLTADDVIGFFKQKKILTHLQHNKDLLAVAIKDKLNVVLCLYNKKNNSTGSVFKIYRPKKLDKDVISMFGNTDMIVFQ